MKRVKFLMFLFLAFNLWFPWRVHADFQEVLSKFHPYLTVQEEYTDNLFLSPTNPQKEWITRVSPGIRISTVPEKTGAPTGVPDPWGIDLDYRLALVYYSPDDNLNYVGHEGNLNTWYNFGERFSMRLKEFFTRSEEPIGPNYAGGAPSNQYLFDVQQNRSVYVRNVVEPSLIYQFGREDTLGLTYRNNIYQNADPAIGDSQENYINGRLAYWFNIRNGISLEYGLTLAEFENSPDFTGHVGTGRYTYRFNPRTSIFAEYTYQYFNFESPGSDYDVNNPSLGIEHAFTPATSGRLKLGYFWQNSQRGSSSNGFSYDAGLTHRAERITYDLSAQGGYTQNYFTAENLGMAKTNWLNGKITYLPTQRMTLELLGKVGWAEYTAVDRTDWGWETGGNASYQLLRWLTLSLGIFHRERDSNVDAASYRENRGILSLSAGL